MGGLQCSIRVLRKLKSLARSVLNAPSNWTEDQVSDLGNIIGEIVIHLLCFLTPCGCLKTRLHPFYVSLSWSGCNRVGFSEPASLLLYQQVVRPAHTAEQFCCKYKNSKTEQNDVIV